jgi:5'-deoxynucleotidase YfbR-like HD superfamily hydrolase
MLILTNLLHDTPELITTDFISYEKKDHHKKLEYEIGLLLIEEIIRKDINPEERRLVVDYFTRAYNIACIKDGVVGMYNVRDKEL